MDQKKLEVALSKIIPPNKVRESLLDNEFMSDVTFILGKEGTPLKAHKIFLMTSSSVMYKLLSKSTDQQLNFQIQQISQPTMMEICRYAYTDEVRLTADNMLEIFFAASKFEMKILTEKAVDFICKQMNDKTVFKILKSNQTHHNLRINMKCFEYIEKNYQLCLENPDLVRISGELLRTILTTCKISPKSAMSAIKKWTSVNGVDDIDELMGIVALKDFSDESDPEEVPKIEPIKPSTSSNKTSRPKVIRIETDIPKRNQPNIPIRNSLIFPMKITSDSPTTNVIPEKEGTPVFRLYGSIAERVYKYANLDVCIGPQNIFLHSLQFIYDLKSTDKEFEISVIEVDDNRRTTLYNDKVIFSSRTGGPFISFNFMQKIELQAGKKIWFRIEYPRSESRKTYEQFNALARTPEKDILLRKDYSYNSYAEIIAAIFYTYS
ncbi:kelch-like protein 41 [Chironomus tepperi]|uniref:kelch-like protein 41 n=1 Tax=Chironomus tepperi TaxID=113505 RepID=UPI00391F04A1